MSNYTDNYSKWLNCDMLSSEEKAELLAISDNDSEKKSRFSSYLSFGTAGLRGIMKTGMNAMNIHTVGYATQGIANLIIKENRVSSGAVIAYDSRNNSEKFAKVAACVLAANGITTYIFDLSQPRTNLLNAGICLYFLLPNTFYYPPNE